LYCKRKKSCLSFIENSIGKILRGLSKVFEMQSLKYIYYQKQINSLIIFDVINKHFRFNIFLINQNKFDSQSWFKNLAVFTVNTGILHFGYWALISSSTYFLLTWFLISCKFTNWSFLDSFSCWTKDVLVQTDKPLRILSVR